MMPAIIPVKYVTMTNAGLNVNSLPGEPWSQNEEKMNLAIKVMMAVSTNTLRSSLNDQESLDRVLLDKACSRRSFLEHSCWPISAMAIVQAAMHRRRDTTPVLEP